MGADTAAIVIGAAGAMILLGFFIWRDSIRKKERERLKEEYREEEAEDERS